MILFKQCKVHSGLAVEAVGKGFGDHVAEVFVALPVLAKQNQVVGIIIDTMDTVGHVPPGHIYLAANDRLDARRFCGFIKIDTAVHNTMIGDGDGSLANLLHPVHHAIYPAGSVQEAVFCMNM